MKTLTWQKPGQQNVAQELIKIIINYVAELRLSNLVVAPIAVFILSATLLALALGVFPVAANFVVQGLDFAVRTLNEVMEQIQHWSGAQITSAYLSVWQAWLLAVAIVTLWRYVVCRNARRLIVFLLTVNVLIVEKSEYAVTVV